MKLIIKINIIAIEIVTNPVAGRFLFAVVLSTVEFTSFLLFLLFGLLTWL